MPDEQAKPARSLLPPVPQPPPPPVVQYMRASVNQVEEIDAKSKRIIRLTDEQVERACELAGDLTDPDMRQQARRVAYREALLLGDVGLQLNIIEAAHKADMDIRALRVKERVSRTTSRESRVAARGVGPNAPFRVGGFGATG